MKSEKQKMKNGVRGTGYQAQSHSRSLGLLILLFLAISISANSQDLDWFHQKSTGTNQTAMWLLGSWAAGNIIIGGAGMGKTAGSTHYFHQMNLMWNTVNIGIAAFGLLSRSPELSGQISEVIASHRKIENLYLINSGLDILYMAGGAYLIHRSGSSEKRADLLKGYGQSVILQGGFLLAFDTAFWLIQRNLRLNWTDQLQLSMAGDFPGIRMAIIF
jgi:hypothetical protein